MEDRNSYQLNIKMITKSVIITGANRGIGLEFVKKFLQLNKKPDHIIATFRNPGTTTAEVYLLLFV